MNPNYIFFLPIYMLCLFCCIHGTDDDNDDDDDDDVYVQTTNSHLRVPISSTFVRLFIVVIIDIIIFLTATQNVLFRRLSLKFSYE